jgi:hypothetical protein
VVSLFTKNLYYKFLNSLKSLKNIFLIENDFMLNNNSINKVLLKDFKKEKNFVLNPTKLFNHKQHGNFINNKFSNSEGVSEVVFCRHVPKQPLVGMKNNLSCLFLRKSKYFNKGRYSRNRQIYRTGVYLCFYVNIAVLYLLWYTFYKFSIRFTYLW